MKVPMVSSVARPAVVNSSSIEVLEDRIAPAGVVNVSFLDGKLILDGDDTDSGVMVYRPDDGVFRVEALEGSTLNGEEVTSLDFTGEIKSFEWNGRGGNDALLVADILVDGHVTLNGGEGDNSLTFSGGVAGGHFTIENGAGNDRVEWNGGIQTVGGDLRIDNGGGQNIVESFDGSFSIGGSLSVEGSDSADALIFQGESLSVGHNLSVESGDGENLAYFYMGTFHVGGNVTLRNGDDIMGGYLINTASGFVGGNLTIVDGSGDSGQILDFAEMTIGGNLSITGGGSYDGVQIGSDPEWPTYDASHLVVGGHIKIDLGDGDNTVLFGLNTLSVGGHVDIQTGDGSDWVRIGTLEDAVLEFGGDLRVDVGEGPENTVTTWGGRIAVQGSVIMTGGSGYDFFALEGGEIAVERDWIVDSGDGFDTVAGGAWAEFNIGRDVQIHGGEYENTIRLNAEVLSIGRDLTVNMGGVETRGSFEVEAITSATIGRNLSISGVTSENFEHTVSLNGGNLLEIGGNLEFVGSPGDDSLWIHSNWRVDGDLTFDGGAGQNRLYADYVEGSIGGDLQVTSDGSMEFWCDANLVIGGDAAFDLGTGQNFSYFWGSTQLSGNFSLVSRTLAGDLDGVVMFRASIGGDTLIRLGEAEGGVGLEDVSLAGKLQIETGGGTDFVSIEREWDSGSSTFAGPVSIALGEGDDFLTIGNPEAGQYAEFLAKVIVNGGGGVDLVNDIAAENVFGPKSTLKILNVEA